MNEVIPWPPRAVHLLKTSQYPVFADPAPRGSTLAHITATGTDLLVTLSYYEDDILPLLDRGGNPGIILPKGQTRVFKIEEGMIVGAISVVADVDAFSHFTVAYF